MMSSDETVVEEPILTPASMARFWGMAPEASGGGEEAGRVGACLWRFDVRSIREMAAAPDPSTHTVIIGVAGLLRAVCPGPSGQPQAATFRPDMLLVTPAGERSQCVLTRARGAILQVFLPDTLVRRCADQLQGAGSPMELRSPPLGTVDREAGRLGQSIVRELQQGTPEPLVLDAAGVQLAIHLLRHWSSRGPQAARRDVARGSLSPHVLRRVLDEMETNLASGAALERLAAVAGLSLFHFGRAFKQSTGLPPHRWLIRRRVERARELLAETNLSITEVAAAVGYDNPGHFAKIFRRENGFSPNEYRRDRRS